MNLAQIAQVCELLQIPLPEEMAHDELTRLLERIKAAHAHYTVKNGKSSVLDELTGRRVEHRPFFDPFRAIREAQDAVAENIRLTRARIAMVRSMFESIGGHPSPAPARPAAHESLAEESRRLTAEYQTLVAEVHAFQAQRLRPAVPVVYADVVEAHADEDVVVATVIDMDLPTPAVSRSEQIRALEAELAALRAEESDRD